MMEVFWFIIVVAFLVFGMYQSVKYAKRAEKEEKEQGEYRYYIFTAFLLFLNAVMFGCYFKTLDLSPWLFGLGFVVIELVMWVFLGTGKTCRAAIFTSALTLVTLTLSVKLFLLP